ncbi:MAG: VCBS repeat-containing protein [Bacteroidia bacterium]|nr:VCBS repeat-containing protein [Bacteroidia bacterium]
MRIIAIKLVIAFFTIPCYGQEWMDVSTTHLPEIVRNNNNTMDTEFADIDGDGDLDMVMAIEFYKNVILINNGKGYFSDGSDLLPNKEESIDPKPYRYFPYHDSEDVAIADFDKDGLIEILIVTEDDETNEYYEINPQGQFDDLSDRLPGKGVTNGIIAADFDNDGWIDVVLANNGQNFFWSNQEGKLIDTTKDRLPQSKDVTQDLEAGDYDGDGDLDILIGNESENKLLENNGSGIFTDVSKNVFTTGISEETREADFGDVDGDGDLDIYFANVAFFTESQPIQRLLIQEGGKFIDVSDTKLSLMATGGTVDGDFVDIDGDGDLDLLCGNGTLRGTENGFTIALNDGHGKFEDNTDNFIASGIKSLVIDVEVADLNGDGRPDIYLSCFRAPDRLYLSTQ